MEKKEGSLDKLQELSKRLGDKETELREFFELCPDLFGIANEDGTLADINNAWVETLGYEREELLCAPIFSFVDQEDKTKAEALVEWMKSVQVKGVRLKMVRKDGGVRWIDWSASKWNQGRAYISGHDVTHRVLARNVLEGKSK